MHPSILGIAGFDVQATFVATAVRMSIIPINIPPYTIIVSGLGTICMGLFADVPVILAPGNLPTFK